MCVCQSDEVMREADANETSGELGSALPGRRVGESSFMTTWLDSLIKSASWLPLVSVVLEYHAEWWALKSPSTSVSVPVIR